MSSRATDYLNSLLRGELAAAETYRRALAKVNGDPGAAELRRICREHLEAAETLRECVQRLSSQTGPGSRASSAFCKVKNADRVLANTAALRALQKGEECGAEDYEDALDDDHLPAEYAGLIRSKLLPRARAHIPVLNQLLEAQRRTASD
jgi:hypothetical protein